jgi:hypothetical protein
MTAQKSVLSWKDKYKWVTYNSELDKMFCEFCLAHPTVANKNGSFFICTITVHIFFVIQLFSSLWESQA